MIVLEYKRYGARIHRSDSIKDTGDFLIQNLCSQTRRLHFFTSVVLGFIRATAFSFSSSDNLLILRYILF